MKYILLALVIVIVASSSYFVVAQTTVTNGLTEDDLGTQYNYKFIINESIEFCDMHILRPQLYREIGRYPDQISYFSPEVVIGFFKPITKSEESFLIQLMTGLENQTKMCTYPDDVAYEIKARIHPEMFQNLMGSVGVKPLYHADEYGNVTLILIGDVGRTQIDQITTRLCNMWEVTAK